MNALVNLRVQDWYTVYMVTIQTVSNEIISTRLIKICIYIYNKQILNNNLKDYYLTKSKKKTAYIYIHI